MRILVVGVGAVGGYYGARLAAAGRDVTFLVRPRSAQLLAEHGMRVISPHDGDLFIEHPKTVETQDIREPYDLILLSCKAYDLAGAIDSIAPAVGPNTAILPLLNGMAHLAALDARFGPEHVLGGTCFISSMRDTDGTIRHLNDLAEIVFGDRFVPASPRLDAIHAALDGANFKSSLRADILQRMWDKWGFLATLAGITCMMRASIGDIVAVDPTLPLRLYAECVSIAVAEGYPPTEQFQERERTRLSLPGSTFTASMLRDLEDGGPVEGQHVLGDLLEHAQRKQLATPLLQLAFTHVRCYEERRRRELGSERSGWKI